MPPITLCGSHPRNTEPELDANLSTKVDAGALWVVTAISNPARYKTRYALYRQFRRHVLEDLRLPLVTVECAMNDSDCQVTPSVTEDTRTTVHGTHENGVPYIDVSVVNKSWIWLKENLQNIGLAQVPKTAEAVLFADADIHFHDRNIGTEILHALQTHRVVQPFLHALDLGPRGEVMQVHQSFLSCHAQGLEWKLDKAKDGAGYPVYYQKSGKGSIANLWHPGFCMAWRMGTLNKMQLLEVGILGAGDHHMCGALIGKAAVTLPNGIHASYRAAVEDWQRRADAAVQRDVGYVGGMISHHWHGKKSNRKYIQRWKILTDSHYNPASDVFKNAQGVLELRHDNWTLRDGIRRYLCQREEDSIDVE